MHASCVVYVDHVPSPRPIEKNDICIQVLIEHDFPCNHEDGKIDLLPSQILPPTTITAENSYYHVEIDFPLT